MTENIDAARSGPEQDRHRCETLAVQLDVVSAAQLRALARLEGMTPEAFAAQVVSARLAAIFSHGMGDLS